MIATAKPCDCASLTLLVQSTSTVEADDSTMAGIHCGRCGREMRVIRYRSIEITVSPAEAYTEEDFTKSRFYQDDWPIIPKKKQVVRAQRTQTVVRMGGYFVTRR